jgi:hypothetical protein
VHGYFANSRGAAEQRSRCANETMAIRFVDDHHATNIIKVNGSLIASQQSELSADGKVITIHSKQGSSGVQNTIEYWDKK